jgi:serine/threonine-protein kinase
MLQIGDQFDRYQITAYMTQGGMSDIYRAFDLVSRREVVIKIPDQSTIGDPAQYERFQRELEVMSSLDHPAILKGLGSGRYNRIPYLASELVEGQSLRKLIEASAPLPVAQAADIVIKIADGMAYCHANNVIHRDLKPENILLTAEGQPVIMDFGLALTKGSHRVTYSNLSAIMGTPEYMAPEQIDGQRGDARTDVYALGAILFEMLSGRPPYGGDTPMAVMAQHLRGALPRLDRLNPAVSPQLAAVAAKSLQKEAGHRYPDMGAFIEAIKTPELADLSILEKTPKAGGVTWSLETIQALKGVGIAFGVLVALIILAVVLQTVR